MPSILYRPSDPPGILDRRFRAAEHVLTTWHTGSPALLDASRGLCYTLNELGWRIWEQIGSGEPVSTIVRTLRQEYDVPRDPFETDVAAFVDNLLAAKLIEPNEP